MLLNHFVMSKNVLRILKISSKYNQRPSEIVGINDTYLAFCFDEACDYILSFKKIEYDKMGNGKEVWTVKPKWIDEESKNKKNNNSELISEMKAELKKFE